MNKLKKQMWAKCAAMLLAVAAGLAMIASAVLAVVVGVVPEFQGNERSYEELFYGPMLSSYSAALWDGMDISNEELVTGIDALAGGNIRYTVQRQQGSYFEDFADEEYDTLYTNDPALTQEDALLVDTYEDCGQIFQYNVSSFPWAMRGRHYRSYGDQKTWYVNAGIEELRYDEEEELFYMVSDGRYFLVPYFNVVQYDTEDRNNVLSDWRYELEKKDGAYVYCDENTGEELSAANMKRWKDSGCYAFRFEDWRASFDVEKTEDDPALEESGPMLLIRVGSWELPEQQIYTVLSYGGAVENMSLYVAQDRERTLYRVLLSVCEEPAEGLVLKNGCADFFWDAKAFADSFYSFSRWWGWYLSVSTVLFLLFTVFLMCAAGHRRQDDAIHLRWVDRVPFVVYTGVMIFAGSMAIAFTIALLDTGIRFSDISLGLLVAGTVLPVGFTVVLVLLYGMSIAVRVKAKVFWRYTLCYYVWRPFAWCIRAVRENVSLYVKSGFLFLAVTLFEFVLLAGWGDGLLLMVFLLFKLVETPLLIHYLWQLNRLQQGGRRIAAGDYSKPIDTAHMTFDFKKHAENLNSVSSGISRAVEERTKSERFRTELITNVSHDIKTPLTSIINYVDLIQKEEITSPTMKEYLAVLQRQSLRLKKLIEDLMEVSKASTGNLSVSLEPCDATVMLSQVVGEFSGRAEANHLELVVESPKPPVEILADGRHLWRVLDNLMSNVCKYAMPGTRVYINLEVFHGMVIMTFRNISKSRLNISGEELMERFVRGDSSRNTEGSGLGLNIAQSLTALMNGNMAIQVDGDLFKAIVSFEELKRQD